MVQRSEFYEAGYHYFTHAAHVPCRLQTGLSLGVWKMATLRNYGARMSLAVGRHLRAIGDGGCFLERSPLFKARRGFPDRVPSRDLAAREHEFCFRASVLLSVMAAILALGSGA